jgi:hypothetical protein
MKQSGESRWSGQAQLKPLYLTVGPGLIQGDVKERL